MVLTVVDIVEKCIYNGGNTKQITLKTRHVEQLLESITILL